MWGVSGMHVHEIRGYGLVYKEVARLITSGHLGILLLVIPLGVTGLKKTRFLHLPDLFGGRGKGGSVI